MVTVEVNLINSISLVKTDPGCGVRTAEDQNSEQYAPPQKKKKIQTEKTAPRQVGHINMKRRAHGVKAAL